MVIGEMLVRLAISVAAGGLLAVEESAESLLERLDPPRRAAVLMAILGLVLLGIVLVVCVMIGGRWIRRLARHNLGPTAQSTHVENRRLRAALKTVLPKNGNGSGETTVTNRKNDETVNDG